MILSLILSVIFAFGLDCACMILSGGTIGGLINGYELPGIIVILAGLIFLAGSGKDFCRIFAKPSKLQTLELTQLRRTEKSLDFANKAVFYICLFFILIGGIFFYLYHALFTVHKFFGVRYCPAVYFAYSLVSKAHAQNRNFSGKFL